MEQFQTAYPINDSDMARVDAFAMFYCSSQFEMYRPYNKSIISIAALRYEACRTPPRWQDLNGNVSLLFRQSKHIIGANNQYDREYIRYFTGLKVDLIPSFCVYTGGSYNPKQNSYIFYPQRDGFQGEFATFWETQFRMYYNNFNATFELVPIRAKYFETEHLASHIGIVHVPYQVSTMSIFEQYRMGIPLFFAAYETFVKWNIKYRIVYDRTSAMLWGFSKGSDIPPHETQRRIPDPNDESDSASQRYWFRYADYYTFPHITYFQSIEQLVQTLHEMSRERLFEISTQMRAFNRLQLKQLLQYWRARLLDIAASSSNNPY